MLDFDAPQPSNLHPYYHSRDDLDCVMVGHKCNCPTCRPITDLMSPARQRRTEKAVTAVATIEANPNVTSPPQPANAPAADKRIVDVFEDPNLREPGSLPPRGLVISENYRSRIEEMANNAPVPLNPAGERAASPKKLAEDTALLSSSVRASALPPACPG